MTDTSGVPNIGNCVVMDIWLLTILGVIGVLAIYCLIRDSAKRRREEKIVRKLFAYAYQTKDILIHLSAIQDHYREICERLPSVSPDEVKRIESALVKKSMALSILSYLKMEKGFEFLGNNPFLNVALQKEDLAAVRGILEAAYAPENQLYDVDLNDDNMSPLLALLKEFANSRSE